MKNTIFLALAAFCISASANAQSTVDSIAAKYKLLPMPGALTIEKTFPVLGTYQLNNVADSAVATTVMVTIDSASKGMVWVEGLPQGKFKAYLKQSPATYRIINQKTESGKQLPEGTLMLDTATKTLNIALGAPYNEVDPAGIFALNAGAIAAASSADNTAEVKVKTKTSKMKAKITYYTASKVEQTPVVAEPVQQPVDQQQQTTTDSTDQKQPAPQQPQPQPQP